MTAALPHRGSGSGRPSLAAWTGLLAWAGLSAACLGGCGPPTPNGRDLQLTPVTGRITWEGRPLVGASVVFERPDQTFSLGVTDEEGRYRMMFNSETPGVLPGPVLVRISMSPVSEEPAPEDPAETGSGPLPRKSFRLPASYHRESHLRVLVGPDRCRFDFDLRADGSTRGPTRSGGRPGT